MLDHSYHTELVDLFEATVDQLPATREAKAYIQGLFLDQADPKQAIDLSKESIVLNHIGLKRYALNELQRIGDWVLWVLSWFPRSVAQHREVVENLGRLNYLRCYRLVPSWKVYEELGDMLPVYTSRLYRILHPLTPSATSPTGRVERDPH